MKPSEVRDIVGQIVSPYVGYYLLADTRIPSIWLGNALSKIQVIGLEVQIPVLPESAYYGITTYSQNWTIYLIQHNELDGSFLNSNLINATDALLKTLQPSKSNYLPNARRDPDIEVNNAVAIYWDVKSV